ncbi:MAG: BTAD domain-containing putative transcriptional regulator [Umezawaea sp.]
MPGRPEMRGAVNVLLLGPVGIERDSVPVLLSSPRLRALLAALGLAGGRSISSSRLAELAWSDRRTPTRSTVAVTMHRLRNWLRQETGDTVVIHADANGYAMELTAGAVDVARFRELATAAKTAAPAEAAALLRLALRLWRGPALENVPSTQEFDRAVTQLEHERWTVLVRYAEASVRADEPETAVEVLRPAADDHPLDEAAHAVLIEALAAAGRQAEALDSYQRLRVRLAEKLGVDPGPRLREAHLRVLRQELPARTTRVVPAQLPAAVAVFVGRDKHLKQLDDHATGVSVIAGTAGIGKTALALRWAHSVRDQFPDGQLFVNLRGFDPGGTPLRPHDVLGRFLRALGVDDIPGDTDEAATLYRSCLSGRRMLVLLDNASSSADVRVLLPGTPTCAVVVTSRSRLSGLVAQQEAQLIELAALPPSDSAALLRSGSGRDDEALDALAEQCSHLPLALRLAAAYLTCHPSTAVAAYTERLASGSRLSVLDNATDDHDAVSAAFHSSYTTLSETARELFRLLSLVPGLDVSLPAAAALLGVSFADVQRPLKGLCATYLAVEHLPGRYTAHDLLRAYSTARAEAEQSPDTLTRAARALVDFYTDTVFEAAPLLRTGRRELQLDIVRPVKEPLRFDDRTAVLDWLDHERDNLIGVMNLAQRHGWHTPVWHLVDTLFPYFTMRRRWPEWFDAYRTGLASAEFLGDEEALACMHIGLGVAHKQTGDHDLARVHYTAALRAAETIGHTRLTVSCRINLGGLCVNNGDPATGVEHLRAALAKVGELGQPQLALALHINHGCALMDLEDLEGAAEALTTALDIALATDDLQRACYAHHNLAEVALRRDLRDLARHHADAQLELARRCGDPVRLAGAFDMLGSTTCQSDLHAARRHWREAHTLYLGLGHQLADHFETWLSTMNTLGADALREADRIRRHEVRKLY